ncbi:MAG: DUF58 domain-containing protein [Bacteroidetes bacterium]|nr:DUF58 domain-containing protein [Bacteroidota bacterium]
MLEVTDILARVRKIALKTRRLSDHIFGGEYHSSFKGRGMTFSEVRKYEYGDDVRSIDWNVTARNREPYSKVFEEERELTLMLAVDVSASGLFGSGTSTKIEKSIEIAAILAFSALQNNDKVGLLAFSDRVELFLPPKKGKAHLLRIIRELLVLTEQPVKSAPRETNIDQALSSLSKYLKKRTIVFVLSDFLDQDYEKSLRIIAKRHDVNGFRIYDSLELSLPGLGLIPIKSLEAEGEVYIDTDAKTVHSSFKSKIEQEFTYFEKCFSQVGAPTVSCELSEDHIVKLLQFFKSKHR